MHPFASYVLRSYYKETGWNEDNLYANLTRSSKDSVIIRGSQPKPSFFSSVSEVVRTPSSGPKFGRPYALTVSLNLRDKTRKRENGTYPSEGSGG